MYTYSNDKVASSESSTPESGNQGCNSRSRAVPWPLISVSVANSTKGGGRGGTGGEKNGEEAKQTENNGDRQQKRRRGELQRVTRKKEREKNSVL